MALINLTEAYRATGEPSLYERMRMWLAPDVYYASSLSAVEEFRQAPPKKKDRAYEALSAYVIVDSLELRLIESNSFGRWRDIPMLLMNPSLRLPSFRIRDMSAERAALWGAGNASMFREATEAFGLNKESFSSAQKVYLQYVAYGERGFLVIKGFGSDIIKSRAKGLVERLSEMMPELMDAAPQNA
ncbi:MAG TPA: hypothetical protein HA362_02385 [Nanoarchaeota archaeon]|nr:hypothetical protein [Nanoarchaeota archaeon]